MIVSDILLFLFWYFIFVSKAMISIRVKQFAKPVEIWKQTLEKPIETNF
jgi:hypothetical protein